MTGTAMGPLTPDSLKPEVKALVFDGKPLWHDGPIACHYADAEFAVVLGMVGRTMNGWDAYDLQHVNSSKTGPQSIGHFSEQKGSRSAQDRAKQAVEEYWSVVR